MIREPLKIYTDNGLGDKDPLFLDYEIQTYTYESTRMGMPKLTATLKYEQCLDDLWTGKEYVTFNGERYYIRHTPSSSKSNTDARYVHELEFRSERDELLGNVYFYDAVYNNALTYDKPCSNSTKFTFFGTLREFVDRLNCVFRYRGIGDSILRTKTDLVVGDKPIGDGYCALIDLSGDYDKEESKELSFEDTYLWDAITECYNQFEVPFELRGRTIIFGSPSITIEKTFRYGYDNELLSINKKNANAKVINRITMQGSSENIPYFYPNESEYGHITLTASEDNYTLKDSDIEIVNIYQLLSKVRMGDTVTYTQLRQSVSLVTDALYCGFEDDGLQPYTLGTPLKKGYYDNRYTVQWRIKIRFAVSAAGKYMLDALGGRIWYANGAGSRPTDMDSLLQGAKLTSLIKNPVGSATDESNVNITTQAVNTEDGIDMGVLENGIYDLTVSVRVQNVDHRNLGLIGFCELDTVSITSSTATVTSGYAWRVGDTDYEIGQIGLRINLPPSDRMVGDSFTVDAVDRINFQERLMPPIYRETNGEERFYEAINNKYPIPDKEGEYYTFPNPYIEGAPNEYIYENEEIKPTIEGVRNTAGKLFGEIVDIAYDDNDNDSLKVDADEDSDKNDALKYEHSYFYVKLNIFDGAYGFNLFKQAAQTDAMTLQMTSGTCNGCKFKVQAVEFTDESGLKSYSNPVQTSEPDGYIVGGDYSDKVRKDNLQEWQQDTSVNSVWICVQKDADTFSVILPNQSHNYKPKIGDKFNIINIDLPLGYILAAEKRLEEEGIQYMAENNEEKFTFDISASRIFFADNLDLLSEIDEYVKLKIEYDGKVYEQFVSGMTIAYEENAPLPNISVSLVDKITVGESFAKSIVNEAVSMIPASIGGAGGGLTTAAADRRYLSKLKSDRTPFRISSDKGFEVGEFVSGSQGAILMRDPNTGRTYMELDELKVRMKAIFEELEISHISSVRGEMILSPGGSIEISYVEETDSTYRCYFKGREDDTSAECSFKKYDLAICKNFNETDASSNVSNRYYWREVVNVDNENFFVELSKTNRDYSVADEAPQVGDTICHLGSSDDVTRQSAIVLSTVNIAAPSITLYDGIDEFSLEGCAVIEYGVDHSKMPPEPFFNCYGRFYFGRKDQSTYLRYEPSEGSMIFKGRLSIESTIEGQTVNEFVNGIIDPKLDEIQKQIDGVIETWFGYVDPEMNNAPAVNWTTNAQKDEHLGDLYYNNTTGTAWRFTRRQVSLMPPITYTYEWVQIPDDAVAAALAAAQEALEAANNKMRVFVDTPYPPYAIGDLWLKQDQTLLRCRTPKAEGQSFAESDWINGTTYDNTQTAINGGIITTGIIRLASYNGIITAGITGGTTASPLDLVRIWAGDTYENRYNAPFRVLQDGSMVASKANITGKITAESGEIAGWKIEEDRLASKDGSIQMLSSGTLQAGADVRLDGEGLSMSYEGYDRLRVANIELGEYSEYLLQNNASGAKNAIALSPTIYFSSQGQQVQAMVESIVDVCNFGYFEKGSTIAIENVTFRFQVPYIAGGSCSLVYATNSFVIEIECNGTVEKSWYFGNVSSPISSGNSFQTTMPINEDFTIQKDGVYTIRYRTDPYNLPRFTSTTTGATTSGIQAHVGVGFNFSRKDYQKNIFARNGQMGVFGKGAMMMTDNGFIVMYGRHGLKVNEEGLFKTDDGGTTWENL